MDFERVGRRIEVLVPHVFVDPLAREDLASVFRHKERMTFEQFLHVIDDRKQGALRVSVGLATNFSDVYQFVQFAKTIKERFASPASVDQARYSTVSR